VVVFHKFNVISNVLWMLMWVKFPFLWSKSLGLQSKHPSPPLPPQCCAVSRSGSFQPEAVSVAMVVQQWGLGLKLRMPAVPRSTVRVHVKGYEFSGLVCIRFWPPFTIRLWAYFLNQNLGWLFIFQPCIRVKLMHIELISWRIIEIVVFVNSDWFCWLLYYFKFLKKKVVIQILAN
jgi:hypothetical protein